MVCLRVAIEVKLYDARMKRERLLYSNRTRLNVIPNPLVNTRVPRESTEVAPSRIRNLPTAPSETEENRVAPSDIFIKNHQDPLPNPSEPSAPTIEANSPESSSNPIKTRYILLKNFEEITLEGSPSVSTPGESLCCICMANKRNIILQPCGHYLFCHECANRIQNCSVCKEEIKEKIRTYY